MRVLHIVRQFSPAIGGLENFVLCLARAQLAAGLQPEVLTLNTVFHRPDPELSATEVLEGILVKRLPWFGSHRYPITPSVAKHLAGYDIIHVHAVDFFADYLSLIRPLHHTPLVLSTHGGFFHSGYASKLKKIFFNTVTRWSVRGYQKIIACSEGDYEMFSPICKPWLRLIENGVDIEKFAQAGARSCQPKLLFIGRFSDNKRIDLLLETVSKLTTHTPEIQLTLIGRDWDNNLARIHQQIASLHLAKHVNVLLDLDDEAIKSQIAQHSFVVSASDYEGFGMTLVEGMAAGLIPIASPISSFQKIVAEAGVGLITDFHNPANAAMQIAAYIDKVANDYDTPRAQAIQAATKYGWPGTANKFHQVYEQVLGTRVRNIQGVAIDTRSGEDIIHLLDDAIENRRSTNVAIANAHTINLARNESKIQQLLQSFLVLNDGAGVNIASRWKYGKPFIENLNGTDFVPRYLSKSARSLRIFLVGAQPDVIQAAHTKLAERYPQHQWLGFQDGYAPASTEDARCAHIQSLSPDLVLIAMGNPLQEEWIARCHSKTGAAVHIGVGALFDFVAGKVERAPLWVRRCKLEWVFRLAQEPGRLWRRYLLGNVTFLWAAWGDRT